MHHDLKCWPAYFQAVLDGRKNFEIRNNRDRGFQSGDTVTLREWDPEGGGLGLPPRGYTGRNVAFRIGYVCDFEQKPGYVVFSLLPLENAR
jgi:hypothetical protein